MPPPDAPGLHWIDITIVGVYVAVVTALGWYYGRRQSSGEEYFVANRRMNPVLVGISLFATLFSTITFLSTPGEVYAKGPATLAGLLAIPFAYIVVGYLLIPALMKHRVTSAYEILGARFGRPARIVGAASFVAIRLVWMSLLVYFIADALRVMLDLEPEARTLVTFLIGGVAVVYSALGGLRAVMITDAIQFALLAGGTLLVLGTITVRVGGFHWFPTAWVETWDTQPFFSLDPRVRASVFGVLISATTWHVCTAGSDQTAIQRFMATQDARSARRSYLANSLAGGGVMALLALVGLALLGYYRTAPNLGVSADLIFPRFISHELPPGVSGFVMAGMFAAAMSSLDSGVNSISAVVVTDFLPQLRSKPLSPTLQLRVARALAFAIGLVVVLASPLMEEVPGNFLAVAKRTTNVLIGPLFGVFVMALFMPFVTLAGALAGMFCGTMTSLWIAFGTKITDTALISFLWIAPASLTVTLLAGAVVSAVHWRLVTLPRRRTESHR